jgi:PUA domain protein
VEVHTVNLYVLPGGKGGDTKPLFYETKDDLIPHLKLVHRFPESFDRIRIDRGAIRFVLSGAKLAAPGLTSTGGRLPGEGDDEDRYGSEDLDEGDIVVIEAEGKENACMVGTLLMGTEKMKKDKKGYAMDDGHYLGDHLWSLPLD